MEKSEKLSKIWRIARKVLLWLSIVFAILLITSLVLSYVYRDKITNFVGQELVSQLNGDIRIEKINLSFWHSFPNVTIQLHSVLAHSTDSFNRAQFSHNTDTALYANRISLVFNAIDFFNQRYIIQHIDINKAKLFYYTDKSNHHNWNFIKPSADTTTQNYFIELSKISLFNTSLTLHLLPQEFYTRQYAEDLLVQGDFFSETIRCAVSGEVHSTFIELSNTRYAQNYDLKFKTDIAIDSVSVALENCSLSLPFLDCKANAHISTNTKNPYINAQYTISVPSFKDLQPELPTDIIETIAPYEIDGKLNLQGWCKGTISDKTMPAIEAKIVCEKGEMLVENEKLTFSFSTMAKSSDAGNLTAYKFNDLQFDAALKNSTASGLATLSDLENLNAEVQAQTNINVSDLATFTKSTDYTLDGTVKGRVHYHGSLLDLQNITPAFFTKKMLSAQLQAENVSYTENEKSPFVFSKINGKFDIQGTDIQLIDTISGVVQNNTFTLRGKLMHILPYMWSDNHSASLVDGAIELGELNLTPFVNYLNAQPASNSQQTLTFETTIKAQSVQYEKNQVKNLSTKLRYTGDVLQLTALSAQSLHYDKHVFKNLKTELTYANNSLHFPTIQCAFLSGTYAGSALVTFANDATTHCKIDGSIKTMSIREVFSAFNNFDQTFLQAQQINGVVNADFALSMKLDKNNDVDYSTVNLNSKINVKNGEISNFEPFVAIGKKLKVDGFNNVTFNQIENTLTIKNDTVHIPRMDINTNVFELKVSGTHTISSNEFKYFISVYLKKTLATMFQKHNKTEDFGEIEQNTDGNIIVPLKLFGTPDTFNIDYDFKTSLRNVKQSVEQQKSEWRTIISGGQTPPPAENTEKSQSGSTQPTSGDNTQKAKKNTPPISSGFEIEY
ncbi:MAG: AsmA-like C-terminal region-containing protein [Bacteroidales bacterium]|jgi:hypothetical protein|nr:AsmA-like C-terminal region-containing protein [Bacteroidales bacterium]